MATSRRRVVARLKGDVTAETVVRANSVSPAGSVIVELVRNEFERTTMLVVKPCDAITDEDGYGLPTAFAVVHPGAVRALGLTLLMLAADHRAVELLNAIPARPREERAS